MVFVLVGEEERSRFREGGETRKAPVVVVREGGREEERDM